MNCAEVWKLQKKEEQMLETRDMKMLRTFRGVTWLSKISREDIWMGLLASTEGLQEGLG